MTTLTIPRDRLAAELRPGDRVVAIDGQPENHVVGEGRGRRGGIPLRRPAASGVEWFLYPDSHVAYNVTVERAAEPEPQPAKPKRTRPTTRRTKYGLTLTIGLPLRGGYRSGAWETADRDYSIQQASAVTYCEGPHPMRWKDDDGRWQRGYCIGDQEHDYIIGWTIEGPQVPGGPEIGEPHETLDEAWAFLADALRKAGGQ